VKIRVLRHAFLSRALEREAYAAKNAKEQKVKTSLFRILVAIAFAILLDMLVVPGGSQPIEAKSLLLTYSISGRVIYGGGNPIPDVTISDGAGHTLNTDSNGNYSLSGLATGTYTITASKSGYHFIPLFSPSASVTVPPDATGKDFMGFPPPLTLYNLSDASQYMITNTSSVLANTTHGFFDNSFGNNVYTFNDTIPAASSKTYDLATFHSLPKPFSGYVVVSADEPITGTVFYSISGSVNGGTGVTISDNAGHIATTDSSDYYRLKGLATGSYTLTASKSGYTFSASFTQPVTVPPDAWNKNFTGSLINVSISGRVTDGSNNPISGVTISDWTGLSTTTDSNGNYTLSGLAEGTYTIVPGKSGYTFSPASRDVTVPPRKTGQDFLGAVQQQTTAVPFFSQRDPRWINYPLRTNGACSADCNTIGACGCTLTSATMVFAYYGSNLTPPSLSDCMGNSACPFAWGAGASCTNGLATYLGQSAFSWSRLDQELNQNHRPVILGTHKASNPQNTHWVVVVEGHGSNASDYYINDPWFPPPQGGAHIKLSTMAIRNAVFDWLSVYSGQPNPISSSSAIVRPSPNRPNILSPSQVLTVTGAATIYTMTDVTMTVQLLAQSSAGNITDMMVWTDTTPSNTWQPFASLIFLPVSDNVYARFRDEFGNVSDPSSDTTYPVKSPVSPPAQIFLPLITR
jgi:hypothetical protein